MRLLTRTTRVVRVTEMVSGRFVEYRWDSDRVVEVVASDGRRVAYRYDADGVLTSVTGVGGTVAYGVDGALLVSDDMAGAIYRSVPAAGRYT